MTPRLPGRRLVEGRIGVGSLRGTRPLTRHCDPALSGGSNLVGSGQAPQSHLLGASLVKSRGYGFV